MKPWVWIILGLAALALNDWGFYHWGMETEKVRWMEGGGWPDTAHSVAPVPPPPVVVKPNPAPARPRPDLTNARKVDSLLAVISNKDSAISALLVTQGTGQLFEAHDPTGLAVIGEITILYSPVERHFLTQFILDSVKVPVTTVTVTHTIVERETEWGYVVAGVIVGTAGGALMVWSLNN